MYNGHMLTLHSALKIKAVWKAVQRTMNDVDKFTYLGSTLSTAVHLGEVVTVRTAKVSVAFFFSVQKNHNTLQTYRL